MDHTNTNRAPFCGFIVWVSWIFYVCTKQANVRTYQQEWAWIPNAWTCWGTALRMWPRTDITKLELCEAMVQVWGWCCSTHLSSHYIINGAFWNILAGRKCNCIPDSFKKSWGMQLKDNSALPTYTVSSNRCPLTVHFDSVHGTPSAQPSAFRC